MTETPQEAANRLTAHVREVGFKPVALHAYHDEDGQPLFWKARLKHPNPSELSPEVRQRLGVHDSKWIRPFRLNGHGYELGEPKFEKGMKPIYGLHLLKQSPDSAVWVVEGEQKADRLTKLGLLATTSGSASSADAVDWTPLRGREVAIWPDNDTAGKGYAGQVAQILLGLGCAVSCVDVEALGLPAKADVVDWLTEHPEATKADVLGLKRLPAAPPSGARVAVPQSMDVEPAALLDDVQRYLCRFVAYPSRHASVAHALWIVHTHLMEAWESTPRIAFLSPEPGSGKSRALEASELLVPNPVNAVNVSVAYLFRKVGDDNGRPTILYDECDTVFTAKGENEDIRGLLNAGHRRHSVVGRCVVYGKRIETEETPAYCAVALAGLGDLPDTILTRSVVVRMRRRAPTEHIEPYRRRDVEAEAGILCGSIVAWCAGVRATLEGARPQFPDGVADRDADVWEALLAVADAAGGDWPRRAREAAVALVAESKSRTPSLGVRLLADLSIVFRDDDKMATEALLKKLHAIEEAPWADLRGKPLDARGLAMRLKPYGISSKKLRFGDLTCQGYERGDLLDAWSRYLSLSPIGAGTSGTSGTPGLVPVPFVPDVPDAHYERERTVATNAEWVESL